MPIGRALIVCGLLAWCAVIGLAAGLPAFALHASAGEQAPAAATGFVGSKACERCHADISARWAKTRMANVVRDPKQHPEAFIPDFSIPDPLSRSQRKTSRSFTAASGSSATLRKVGDDYFPLGAQWDVTHKLWRRYFVADNTDWWVPHYPGDNLKRPTGPTCDGCHSVEYDVRTKQVAEWNVGCEKCHGPGAAHAAQPARSKIFNPARADRVHANDTAFNVIRRDSRSAIPSKAATTTGPSASTSVRT